jgi:hypothetical protein
LSDAGWDGKQYRHFPDDVDYRRFRTEVLKLLRVVCGTSSDHYRELTRIAEHESSHSNSYYLKDCLGVLQAAERDFSDGFLFDVHSVVVAEVLGDFIEQAEVLLSAGYRVAAVSLAGAVLEDALRKVAASAGMTVPEKTKIDALNSDLASAGIYDKLVLKRITALAELRNSADHGHFDKVGDEDARDMVGYVRRFCADYLVRRGP